MLTSNNVQSLAQKSLYSFFTCSIASFLSETLGAKPSTTVAASSSVIPWKTSIGTYEKYTNSQLHSEVATEREETALDAHPKLSKANRRIITLTIMLGYFSARSSMLVPPLLQPIII